MRLSLIILTSALGAMAAPRMGPQLVARDNALAHTGSYALDDPAASVSAASTTPTASEVQASETPTSKKKGKGKDADADADAGEDKKKKSLVHKITGFLDALGSLLG